MVASSEKNDDQETGRQADGSKLNILADRSGETELKADTEQLYLVSIETERASSPDAGTLTPKITAENAELETGGGGGQRSVTPIRAVREGSPIVKTIQMMTFHLPPNNPTPHPSPGKVDTLVPEH
ncbi:unnamed protein product [Lota lota]